MEQLIPLGREDLLSPTFPPSQDGDIRLHIPPTRPQPCVWLTYRSAHWYRIDDQTCTPLADIANILHSYRIVVFTQEEAHHLVALGHSIAHIVVLAFDLMVEPASHLPDDVWCSTVVAVREEIQSQLRVDYTRFSSAQQAWRHRGIRRMEREWSNHMPESTERWLRHIHDHPFQEVRTIANKKPRAGVVMDMNKAYASIMEHVLYPKPGPWELHGGFVHHPCALYHVQFTPLDAVGSRDHPWMIPDPKRHYCADISGCTVQGWFIQKEVQWMLRHGRVHVAQTATPSAYGEHPLKNSISRWKEASSIAHTWLKKAWKYKLASAHSWTWSPKYRTEQQSMEEAWREYLHVYGGRPGFRANRWTMQEDIVQWKSLNIARSGWYYPVLWTRLHVRARMLEAITAGSQLGLEWDYANIDGIHWSTKGVDASVVEVLLAHMNREIPNLWRIDDRYDNAVHLGPGIYSLLQRGVWTRAFGQDKPSWIANIVRTQGLLSMSQQTLRVQRQRYRDDVSSISDVALEHPYLQWLSRYTDACLQG